MPVKNPQWRGAFYQTANGYRGDLLKYYICIDGANLLDERQLKVLFKKGEMSKKRGRLSQLLWLGRLILSRQAPDYLY